MKDKLTHILRGTVAATALLAAMGQAHAGTVADLGTFQADYGGVRNGVVVTWDGSKRVYSKYGYLNTVTPGENHLSFAFPTTDPELFGTTSDGTFTQLLTDIPIQLQSDRTDPFVYKVDITVLVSSTTAGLVEASAWTFDKGAQTILRNPDALSLGGATQQGTHTFTTYIAADHVFDTLNTFVTIDYKHQPGGFSDVKIILDKVEISTMAVPEPATWATMLLGLGALAGLAARKRRGH